MERSFAIQGRVISSHSRINCAGYGTMPILLCIAAAFVAGRTFPRRTFALPLMCMMLIAATMYVHFDDRLKWQTASLRQLHPLGLTDKDRELINWSRSFLTEFGKRAYMNFALIPFAFGLVLNAVRKPRLNP